MYSFLRLKKINILEKTSNIKQANLNFEERKNIFKYIKLKQNNIYTAGRYGKWEYYWTDQAINSGFDVVNSIF